MARSSAIMLVAITLAASCQLPREAAAGPFMEELVRHLEAEGAKEIAKYVSSEMNQRSLALSNAKVKSLLAKDALSFAAFSEHVKECTLRAKRLDEMGVRTGPYAEAYHQSCDELLR